MALVRRSVFLAISGLGVLGAKADAQAMEKIRELPIFVQFSVLFGIVFIISVLLFGGDILSRWIYAFLQHHRGCDIPATLLTKGDSFAGHLTVIGLDGCRFEPANKSVQSQLLYALASPGFYDFDIKIGRIPYPVFLDGYHGYFAPLYFFEPISRSQCHDILKLSKIKPVLVASVDQQTTRQKWAADIKERRRKIEALKSSHGH